MFDNASQNFVVGLLRKLGVEPDQLTKVFQSLQADATTLRNGLVGAQQATAQAKSHFDTRLNIIETQLADLQGDLAALTALVRLAVGSQPVRQVNGAHVPDA